MLSHRLLIKQHSTIVQVQGDPDSNIVCWISVSNTGFITVLRLNKGHIMPYTNNVFQIRKYLPSNLSISRVISLVTVPADGVAPNGARPSADTVMTTFSCLYGPVRPAAWPYGLYKAVASDGGPRVLSFKQRAALWRWQAGALFQAVFAG